MPKGAAQQEIPGSQRNNRPGGERALLGDTGLQVRGISWKAEGWIRRRSIRMECDGRRAKTKLARRERLGRSPVNTTQKSKSEG